MDWRGVVCAAHLLLSVVDCSEVALALLSLRAPRAVMSFPDRHQSEEQALETFFDSRNFTPGGFADTAQLMDACTAVQQFIAQESWCVSSCDMYACGLCGMLDRIYCLVQVVLL